MIEAYLIAAGLGCGTRNNFKDEVLKNVRLGISPRWYFRTPVLEEGDGFKAVKLDMAFPFQALITESKDNEESVLQRLELTKDQYKADLLVFLRYHGFTVPVDFVKFTIVPFWAGDSNPREENEDFLGMSIHIYNAVLTVKYRNLNLPATIDPVLFALTNEQKELEKKIDTLTIYVAGADFDALEQAEKDVLTAQLAAMNDYNTALLTRISNY